MKESVYCTARDRAQAERIVDRLKAAGFPSDSISVLFADKSETRSFADDEDTKAPERAAKGATTGAGIGAVLGWLAGIGLLAIPGVGPFIAAGPIMGALGGAASGAAAGGIIGALTGLGVPEHEAKVYDERIRSGNVLVSVHTDDVSRSIDAKEIFVAEGADNVRTNVDFNTGTARTTGTSSTIRP